MTQPIPAHTSSAIALRQALGPGFGLAGPSEALLNTVAPMAAAGNHSHRR